MIDYYPSHSVIQKEFTGLNGQHFGIMESQILTSAQARFSPRIRVCTANMPAYQKVILGENAEINHHLSGYGVHLEEAMIRLLGEGVERYALLLADNIYREKKVIASYNELIAGHDVMPWEYITMYSEGDYEKLQNVGNYKQLQRNDRISWIAANSIFNPGKMIYVPAQLLFTGYKNVQDEKIFAPGFSKGTAAHRTVKKALRAALMEFVEADAFTVAWYASTKARRIVVDDRNLLELMGKIRGDIDCQVFPFEYSLPGMPGYSVGVALMSQNGERPAVVVGCQSDLDPAKAVYKAMLEALAVHYLAANGPLLMPEQYFVKAEHFNNLDSNVAYWADTDNWQQKQEIFYRWCSEQVLLSSLPDKSQDSADKDIKEILGSLKAVSEYGVYLDITPPELQDRSWKVIRTFFPELVQMCLPSYPYSNHPRLRSFGGVKNDLPHPVP